MRMYTLDPLTRKTLVRTLSARLMVMFCAVVFVILAIGVFFVLRYTSVDPLSGIGLMALAAIILALVIGMRLLRQVKEYEQVLDSIKYACDGETLIRHQMRLQDESIIRTEVVALQESSEGMMVLTQDRSRYIFVPVNLKGYADLRQVLSQWKSVTKTEVKVQEKSSALSALWAIGTLMCISALLLSKELWQVVVAGLLMLFVFVFTYRMLRQKGAIDRRFSRTFEGILLFLSIVFLAKLIMVVWPLYKP